jgi:hypothetical protein
VTRLHVISIPTTFLKLLFFFLQALDHFVSRLKEEIGLFDSPDFILFFISVIPEFNSVFILPLEPLNSAIGVFKTKICVSAPQVLNLALPK